MIFVIFIVLGAIMAAFASHKGYSPARWFLAGGLLGLVILAFLPFVNEKSKLNEYQRAEKKKTGDIIGSLISTIAIFMLLVSLLTR